MIKRTYYSVRTGKTGPDQKIDFEVLKRLFSMVFNKLRNDGYFQKYFGIDCTDGYIAGELGPDIESAVYVNLRKDSIYPFEQHLPNYSEDDFFDVLEFLHDHCSKPGKGDFHNWNNCGFHYHEFNDLDGERYFRESVNPLLRDYKEGFELSEKGEILILSDSGLAHLFEAAIPTNDKENIHQRIDNAILKFRRNKSTFDDRRDAIRELADVLEFLRPSIKLYMDKKDEGDIFNIANNFGIRHHNKEQKTDYDKAIWYSWIFYYYLATLHAVIRIVNKGNQHNVI